MLFRWKEFFSTMFEHFIWLVPRLTIIACLWSHHTRACELCIVFYDSNFRRAGFESRIRDRREKGELPCRYLQGGREYSSWFIDDVNPWRKRRVQEETAKEGRTVRSKWKKREPAMGSKVGRSTSKRERKKERIERERERRKGERRQEIFYRRTCFLFALATERDHYEDPLGKRFTTVPRMYIVKMPGECAFTKKGWREDWRGMRKHVFSMRFNIAKIRVF